jgi:hypothetical protein
MNGKLGGSAVAPKTLIHLDVTLSSRHLEELSMKMLRLTVPVAFAALTACAPIGIEGPHGSINIDQPRYGEYHQTRQGGGSYFHEHGYTQLNIPKGHYPPPGECRIWYPDRPAGQQPPPVQCGRPVPPGAWLIQHPHDLHDRVHVNVYDPGRPGFIRAIGEFEIGSGILMRVVLDQ